MTKKILIINGPNLNMLGKRNNDFYGKMTLGKINELIEDSYPKIKFTFFQSNGEKEIIEKIHEASSFSALLINPAAFTHTSVAIRDALEILTIPKAEVHLSDINSREEFRKINFISDVVDKTFMGKQEQSYLEAVKFLLQNLK